jgi:6-phosphofructokinase 1
LIQGEAYPAFENGMPKYVTLKNAPVAKKLETFEL